MYLNKKRINLFSVLTDLLIDLALIGMGVLLYYHFEVRALGPFDLSPVVTNLFGSKHVAVLVISLAPFGIGVINLLRTLARIFTAMMPARKTEDKSQ